MVGALIRTVPADLLRHRVQSLLIVVLLGLATTTLTLGVSVYLATNDPFDRFMRETNGAHLWVTADPGYDLSSLTTKEGVSTSVGPFSEVDVPLPARTGERQELPDPLPVNVTRPEMKLLALPATLPSMGQPQVRVGQWLSAANEIVLSWMFAEFDHFQIGDEFTIDGANGPVVFQIVGFADHPALWDVESDGLSIRPYAFVLPEALDQIVPDRSTWKSVLGLQLDDPQASGTVGGVILDQFAVGAGGGVVVQDWQDVRHDFTENNQVNALLLGVFSVFALIASAFVIANTVGGRVIGQMREIGLLKSVGFTPGGIVALFLAEHLLLGAVALVIGYLAGSALTPLFDENLPLLSAPDLSPLSEPRVLLFVTLVVAITVVVCTIGPALSAARVDAIGAMRSGPTQRSRPASLVAGFAMRRHVPVVISLGLNAVFARPLRSIFTIAALAVTIVSLTFSLGMDATIRDIVDHPENWGQPFALTVEPRGESTVTIEAALNANPDVASYSTLRNVNARIEGDSASVGALVLDGDIAAYNHSIAAGRLFSAPGEAVVGQALLDLTGKQIGDPLRIFTDLGPLDLTIVGRIVASDSRGRTVAFSLDTYIAAFGAPTDSSNLEYAIRLVSGADETEVASALAQSLPRQATVSIQDRSDVDEVRAIIYTLDVILVIIGIVNILTTTMLGVRERVREVGVLKAVGSTPLQTMTSVLAGVCALAILAAVIGLPLGLGATRLLFNELGREIGVGGDLGIMPGASALAIVCVLSMVIVILGGLLPARHASMIRVTDALRHE